MICFLKFFFLIIVVFFTCTNLPAEAFQVITHPETELSEIDRISLKKIYFGKIVQWPNNVRIQPVLLLSGSSHSAFLSEVIKKTARQYRTYMKRAVFTTSTLQPKTFRSESEIIDYVKNTKGAIAYITDKSRELSGVKVLPLVDQD